MFLGFFQPLFYLIADRLIKILQLFRGLFRTTKIFGEQLIVGIKIPLAFHQHGARHGIEIIQRMDQPHA